MPRPSLLAGWLLTAALLLLLARCDSVEPGQHGRLVVEIFFRTNAPPDTLVLRTSAPLEGGREKMAEGADVEVRFDGRRVAYREVRSRPGRYVPRAQEPPLAAGTRFALSVWWNGQRAIAEGVLPPSVALEDVRLRVPEAPVEAVLLDSLRRDTLGIPAEVGFLYPIEVDLSWVEASPEQAVAFAAAPWMRVRLRPVSVFSSTVVDFFLQPEDVFLERRAVAVGPNRRRWTGVYAVPVERAGDPLPAHRLDVALLRSGPDYARYAATRDDPERREPVSNVEGALGIAAGIAVDTLRLRVAE